MIAGEAGATGAPHRARRAAVRSAPENRDTRLDGRVALVSRAARGIGLVPCLKAKAVILDREPAK